MKIQLALFIIQFGCLVFAENQTNTNSLFRPSFETSVRLHSMAASQTNELDFQNLHQEFLGLDPTNLVYQCGSLTIREASAPLGFRIVRFATKGPEDVRGWIRVPDHSDPPLFGGFRSVPGKIYSEEEVAAGRLRNRLARQQVLDFLVSHPDLEGEELWSEYWEAVWRLWLDDENFGHGPLCRAAEHRQEDGISKEGLILWFLGTSNCCGEARLRAEYLARELSLDPDCKPAEDRFRREFLENARCELGNNDEITTSCLLAFSQLMERSDLRIASQPPVDFQGELWRFCHSTSRRAKTTENQESNEGGGIVGNSTEEESKNRSIRDHLARTILFCEMLTNIENHVEFQRREMANVALDLWVGNPACILREPVRRNIDGIPSVFYVLSVLGSYIYPDDIRKFARLMWDEFEKTDELPPGLTKPIRVEEVWKYIEKDPIRLEKRLNQLNCRAMGFDLLSVRESIRNELNSFPDETAKLRAELEKLVAQFPSNKRSRRPEDFRAPSILLLRFCSAGPEESDRPYVFRRKDNEAPSPQGSIDFGFQKTFSDEQVESGRRRNHLARLLVFDRFLSWMLEGSVPENIGEAIFNFMERNYVRGATESTLDPKALRHLREDRCIRPLEAMRWLSTIPQIPLGGELFMDARRLSKHSKTDTASPCDENAPIPAVSQ